MKKVFIAILLFFLLFSLGAQNAGENSIRIQGETYNFRPSTTQSSPPPTRSGDFFVSGKWYGEDAAKAWASVADWAIEQCMEVTRAIVASRLDTVYISAVYIYRKNDSDYDTLRESILTNSACIYDRQIRIDYWVVRSGNRMDEGRREKRWFGF